MARTTEQNQKLVNDFLAAFKAANPDVTYTTTAEYRSGWLVIDQGGHISKHRPTKVEAMIEGLRRRADEAVDAAMMKTASGDTHRDVARVKSFTGF